jgi:putative phosphonate transport system ATP-binding protein
MTAPLLEAQGLTLRFGAIAALEDVALSIWPGEVVAIVGESGSGKSTLLRVLSGLTAPQTGQVRYGGRDIQAMGESARRLLHRTEWGFVHQNPRDGLRMGVSAGGNVGERLMAVGARHYGSIRAEAAAWLRRVEIDPARMDELPSRFSGGMQQRLQIARTLVTQPKLVFMDEPTGGLDVSVQAKLLDMLRALAADLGLAVLLVTHDIAAARLLAHRLLVMRHGRVVEEGLTDRVLDDPQHPYTQLLVASVLAA